MASGNYAIYVNGEERVTGTDSNVPTAFTKIGNNFAGDIAEIVAYDNVLSSITRQKIEAYLAHKWGLENQLPGNHPHKITLPSFGGAQTITFDPLANKTILDSSFELNASASSGLPVVYASSNSAGGNRFRFNRFHCRGRGDYNYRVPNRQLRLPCRDRRYPNPGRSSSQLHPHRFKLYRPPSTIAENQPVGTIVGEFNATDPDANATLTYYLVSGVGDGNNSLFTLDTNGTLKTAATFDYETNSSTYSIRVQARDEYNASVEGNFTVTLTDDSNEDTDGDGFTDAQEISAGTNQNDPGSKPGTRFRVGCLVPL